MRVTSPRIATPDCDLDVQTLLARVISMVRAFVGEKCYTSTASPWQNSYHKGMLLLFVHKVRASASEDDIKHFAIANDNHSFPLLPVVLLR